MAEEQLVLVLFAHGVGSAKADQQEGTASEGSVLVGGFTMAREAGSHAVTTAHFLVVTTAVEEGSLSESADGQSKN